MKWRTESLGFMYWCRPSGEPVACAFDERTQNGASGAHWRAYVNGYGWCGHFLDNAAAACAWVELTAAGRYEDMSDGAVDRDMPAAG